MIQFVKEMWVPIVSICVIAVISVFVGLSVESERKRKDGELRSMRVVIADGHQYVFIGDRHYHTATCQCRKEVNE